MNAKLATRNLSGLLADYDTLPPTQHRAWSPAHSGCRRTFSPTNQVSCLVS